MFGNDSFLWYNVGNWSKLGLAIPNFSDDVQSQNGSIRYLCSVIGRNLQAIMFHPDARLRTPPSINTLTRIHKLCVRGRSILFSRAIPSNELDLEPAHAVPAPEVHLVYPTPYFKVRNQWLKEYCGHVLLALTEAMQHQENGKPIEISENFAGLIGQFMHRVYKLMAVDLFRVPLVEAKKPDFTLSEEQLKSYDPSKWFTSTEMIDTVPEVENIPTEDDLLVLTNGIPITQLPQLGRWPSRPTGVPETAEATGTSGESFAPPPGV